MSKHSLRCAKLAWRKQLASSSHQLWSLRIQGAFLRLPEFSTASCLALYSPIRNEVLTGEIFRTARAMGKTLAYPRICGNDLEFAEVTDPVDLHSGAFGIPEPAGGALVPIAGLDLLVVPGVAFDLTGHRLGYGKGFYDRVLHDPDRRCLLVGLCFEEQLVNQLPAENHDVRMDLLVTEQRMLRFDPPSPHAAQHHFQGGGTGL